MPRKRKLMKIVLLVSLFSFVALIVRPAAALHKVLVFKCWTRTLVPLQLGKNASHMAIMYTILFIV